MEPADTDAIERTERSDHPEIQEAELEPVPAPEPITQHGEGSGRRADAAPAIRQAISRGAGSSIVRPDRCLINIG